MRRLLPKISVLTGILLVMLVPPGIAQQGSVSEQYRNYNDKSLARELIGLEPINESTMKPGDRHIRIWGEFGSTNFYELTFIQKIDSSYIGGSYFYWAYLSFDMDEVALERTRLEEIMGQSCVEFKMAPTIITCRKPLEYEPDWGEILQAATEAGIFNIPPFDSLRIPDIRHEDGTVTMWLGFGGVSSEIETFDGDEYNIEVYLPGWIEEDSTGMEMLNRPLRAIYTRIPFVRAE